MNVDIAIFNYIYCYKVGINDNKKIIWILKNDL